MAAIVPNTGEKEIMERAFKQIEGSKLHLYANDYTASNGSSVGNVTECAVSGYAAITLAAGTFTVSTSAGITTTNYTQQTFSLTTAGSAYGYYVTNSANTTMLIIERFTGAPYTLPVGGGAINVTVNLTGD